MKRTPRIPPELMSQAQELARLLNPAAKAAPPPEPEPAADAADRALMQAALVGRFVPARLAHWASPEEAVAVRSALIDASTRQTGPDGAWLLDTEPRRTYLRRFLDLDPAERAPLLAETPLDPDDRLGAALRDALDGHLPDPETLDQAGLATLYQVAEWVDGLVPGLPPAREIRRELSRASARVRLARMTEDFVGRTEQLAEIGAFIASPQSTFPGVLVVSGTGGTGKSALAARFLTSLLALEQRDRPVTAFVHIDFDRPNFRGADMLNMTLEVTRQVSLQLPQHAAALDDIRHDARGSYLSQVSHGTPTTKSASLEVQGGASREALYRIGSLLGSELAPERPFLLSFDTFEDVQAHSDEAVERFGLWLNTLAEALVWERLRVIVSGRTPVADWPHHPFPVAHEIRLGDLDRDEALELMSGFGWPPDAAARVHDAFGGNPLVLRLLRQLLSVVPGLSLDALVRSDDLRDPDADAALVQGVLYDRILGHIADPDLRRLAHPGLVLRRVTAGLIRHVLAPICLGRDIDEDTARDYLQRLMREAWLVQTDPDGASVSHRRDIRALMLKLIGRDPAASDKADRIHRAAVEYYEGPRGRDMPWAADEALYHRMMVRDGSLIPDHLRNWARRVRNTVGADVDDLPLLPRARLKEALGERLGDREALVLDPDGWARYLAARGQELADLDEPRRALELMAARPLPAGRSMPLWEMSARDKLAEWPEMAADPDRLAGPPPSGPLGEEALLRDALAAEILLKANAPAAAAGLLARQSAAADRRRYFPRQAGADVLVVRLARLSRLATTPPYAGEPGAGPSPLPEDAVDTADMLREPRLADELRRLAWLAGRPDLRARVPPGPSAFVPSLTWLGQAAERAGPTLAAGILALADELRRLLADEPAALSASYLTGTAPAHLAQLLSAATLSEPASAELIAGIDPVPDAPEFRGPARHALADAFRHPAEVQSLALAMQPHFGIRPPDLAPEAMARRRGIALRQAFAAFVHYADQSRVLPRLIAEARARKPEDVRLARIGDALNLWLRAHRPPETAAAPEPARP